MCQSGTFWGITESNRGDKAPCTYAGREWAQRLERAVSRHRGIVLEDKGYSITVHYRRAVDKPAARRAIRSALVGIKEARVFGGKQTVKIVPRTTLDKGVALEHARRLVACDTAIYVGDDRTDEDAFSAAPADRLLTIRIGRAPAATASERRWRWLDDA